MLRKSLLVVPVLTLLLTACGGEEVATGDVATGDVATGDVATGDVVALEVTHGGHSEGEPLPVEVICIDVLCTNGDAEFWGEFCGSNPEEAVLEARRRGCL